MGRTLLIVESPKKAKTIGAILAAGYQVEATFGHIRDLPPKALGVDVENGFTPTYVPLPKARARLSQLRAAVGAATTVLLATDPDREGEAIAWHLVAALGLRPGQYGRVTFHEITARAVREALAHPRALDEALIDAQQARRVLDRLVGYQVSPLLWRKVEKGTSAGRVQSVALRLVVERERQIQAFDAKEYWTIAVALASGREGGKPEQPFQAALAELDGKKPEIPDRTAADAVVAWLEEPTTCYAVVSTDRTTRERTSPPPFTTSTLQQAAAGRLRLDAKRIMALAQSLYEAGLITYHRTDAVFSAPEAVATARKTIAARFGSEYLPEKPRYYANRQKNAQEAHEAIRPSDPTCLPDSLGARAAGEERRLYELIWQRFLASQMGPARYLVDTATVDASNPAHRARLVARATTLVFPGYLAVYGVAEGDEEQPKEGEDDLPANPRLPTLRAGESLDFDGAAATQHYTKPPPRFTESTLVRALEALGVGRPSTYATTLATIEERGYVTLAVGKGERLRAFVPTGLGFAANDFLCQHFAEVVDPAFTARMEEELDEVASGKVAWRDLLFRFYGPFSRSLAAAQGAAKFEVPDSLNVCKAPSRSASKRTRAVPEPTGEVCPRCGKSLLRRQGKRGAFVGCSGYPACDFTRDASDAARKSAPKSGGRSGRRASTTASAVTAADSQPGDEAAAPPREAAPKRSRRATPKPAVEAPRGTVPRTTGSAPLCPRCGKSLVTRTQRSTGTPFLGCSGFPGCRYTAPLGAPGN